MRNIATLPLHWHSTEDNLDWLDSVTDAVDANHPGGLLHIRNHVSKIDKNGYGGKIQNLTLNHKFSYENVLRRSLDECPDVQSIVANCMACGGDKELAIKAHQEQAASWTKSLTFGPKQDNFITIAPGLQVHPDAPSVVYITGLWVCTDVIDYGNPKPPTKSRPLTLVKEWIRDQVPASRVRKPRLSADSFDYVAVAGRKLSYK